MWKTKAFKDSLEWVTCCVEMFEVSKQKDKCADRLKELYNAHLHATWYIAMHFAVSFNYVVMITEQLWKDVCYMYFETDIHVKCQ